MTIRVLQLVNSFTTGGAELMAKRLALGFSGERVKSDLWSMCRPNSPEIESVFMADLEDSDVPTGCLEKTPRLKDPRAILRLARLIRERRYDVLHAHCESPAFYGRLAASLVPGTRRMVTIHNHMPVSAVRMERWMSVVTDLYVACSSEIVSDLRERCGFADERFIRILNGIGEDRTRGVRATREEVRNDVGVPPEAPVALVVARLEPVKAHLDILEALQLGEGHVRRLHVWMVGNDRVDPGHTARVRDAIERNGLKERVRIFGVVEDERLNELMKGADLFLLPSEREGQSVAILEALAAGLPTLISDLETNREVADGGRVAWLVRPNAPPELAATLDAMLGDPEAMRARAREATTFVRAKFGFGRLVEEYARAYEVLGGR